MPGNPTTYDLDIVWDAATNTITLEQNGVNANSLHVHPGDTINYTSQQTWAVQFISEGPAGGPSRTAPPLSATELTGKSNESYGTGVHSDAVVGNHWDYVVAVVDANGNIRTVDPDIVIQGRSDDD